MRAEVIILLAIAIIFGLISIIPMIKKESFQFGSGEHIKHEDDILDVKKFNMVQAKKFYMSALLFLCLAVLAYIIFKVYIALLTVYALLAVIVGFIAVFVIFTKYDKELLHYVKKNLKKKKRR